MKSFDTLEYTKGAEAIGIKREHAEYAAKSMASAYREFKDDSITKGYLAIELSVMEERLMNKINSLEQKLTIRLGSIMIAGIGILGFMLHK